MIRKCLLGAAWASEHHPEREDLARSVPRPTIRLLYYSPSAIPHRYLHNTQRLAVWWSVGDIPICCLAHFPPPMAHPLRGWSAPRGGARPSGGRPTGARRTKTTSGSQCSVPQRRQTKNVCGVTAASASGPIHPRISPQLSCSVAISSWPELDLTRMGEALSR
jgi:hypothetical protein